MFGPKLGAIIALIFMITNLTLGLTIAYKAWREGQSH